MLRVRVRVRVRQGQQQIETMGRPGLLGLWNLVKK